MKHRSLAVVILLSIVTFGIYDLYWFVVTKNAMNERNVRTKVPSIWVLFAPIALLFIVGVLMLAFSTASSQIGSGDGSSGGSVILNLLVLLVGLVAVIGVIVLPFMWLLKYCKAANEYTGGEVNTAVAFILIWILRFIGIAVIQDAFNDVISGVNPKAPIADVSGMTSVPQHLMQPSSGPVSPAAAMPGGPAMPQALGQHPGAEQPPVVPQNPNGSQPPVSPIS